MTLHALYRFFNEAGELLYVGITMNPVARWKQHSQEKTWWAEVAHVSIEPHVGRDAVLLAERLAITTEKPKYNKVHNDQPPVRERSARLRWVCYECGGSIADNDGYLTHSEKALYEYREARDEWKMRHPNRELALPLDEWLSFPSAVPWRAYHGECDPDPDDPGYWIGIERIRTHAAMLEWTAHLMGKGWFKHTDWDQLIYSVLTETKGWAAA